jgi:hypothetical protein
MAKQSVIPTARFTMAGVVRYVQGRWSNSWLLTGELSNMAGAETLQSKLE